MRISVSSNSQSPNSTWDPVKDPGRLRNGKFPVFNTPSSHQVFFTGFAHVVAVMPSSIQ